MNLQEDAFSIKQNVICFIKIMQPPHPPPPVSERTVLFSYVVFPLLFHVCVWGGGQIFMFT